MTGKSVTRRKRRRRQSRRRQASPRRAALALALGGVVLVLAAWFVWPFWSLSGQFNERTASRPSQLYGAPIQLAVGEYARQEALLEQLSELGYRRVSQGVPRSGELRSQGARLAVHLRPRPTTEGGLPASLVELRFAGQRVDALLVDGERAMAVDLDRPLIAAFYGPERREKRPVDVSSLPAHLVEAVLAAEDSGFLRHAGVSPRGILRATWANVRGGEIRQGGSTLTQQLVKNLFLTHERTIVRKLREAILAVLIDLRYDKQEILSAYLNEIYWGSSDGVNLMGVGAASWAYFGKQPRELDLCESAVLAGMIRSPGAYSPITRAERARARRDQVLRRMRELKWIDEGELETHLARPLCVDGHPLTIARAPYFVDAAAREAHRRFGVSDLAGGGFVLLSTLDAWDQRAAEKAVRWGVEALEGGWEKGAKRQVPLQAALVSLDPRDGSIRAYVGGRDYSASQFDRVASARRQPGSAFKPVVFAAAFETGAANPASLLEDAPLSVALARTTWTPRNSDGQFRGWITARRALEQSLNVPTARLALDVGLPEIMERARRLGIDAKMQEVPALALGAFEVTPIELATVYATFASGGMRHEPWFIEAVLDGEKRVVSGKPLPPALRAVSRETAYLVTSVLQGVLDRGTGRGAREQGVTDLLAGKTGTTNERRDSWFAGYSPDRATLVWVGYDDSSETRLSGARAALPIWSRFVWARRPAGGYPIFRQPPGVTTATIDPLSGELATGFCPEVMTEVFYRGDAPQHLCYLHGRWGESWRERPPRVGDEAWRGSKKRRPWRWLRKVFGKERRDGAV